MVDFKISGFKSFEKRLKGLSKKLKAKTARIISQAVVATHAEAVRSTPVDTGRLRSSIRFSVDDNRLAGQVFTDVFYAPFVEFGTVNLSARPFLFPAWDSQRKKIIRVFNQIDLL